MRRKEREGVVKRRGEETLSLSLSLSISFSLYQSLSLIVLCFISLFLSHLIYTPFLCFIFSDISRSMIDAAKTIMEGVRDKNGTDSVFYDKSGEVLKRADQKVIIMLCYTVLYYVIARYFVIYRLALYFVIYRLALYFIIYRLAQYFIILFHELRK